MELQEMRNLINELSKSRDNYSLCLRLEEISKSKNFKEGIISNKLINHIVALGNKIQNDGPIERKITDYDSDTLFLITKILTSRYFFDGSIKTNEVFNLISKNSDKYDLYNKSLNYKLAELVVEKIAVRRYGAKIYEFFADILQVPLEDYLSNQNEMFKKMELQFLIPLIKLFLSDKFYYGVIWDYALDFLKKYNNVPLEHKLTFLRTIVDVFTNQNYCGIFITEGYLDLLYEGAFRKENDDKGYRIFDYSRWSFEISNILVGKNFKDGKVKDEDFDFISNSSTHMYYQISSIVINSENYANGLIPHNWIVILENIKNESLHKALVNLFISDYYANGLITKEQIEDILKIFTTKGEEQKNDNDFNGFVNLLISDIYQDNEFRYEDIKFMLDDKYEVFRTIVDCILKHNDLSKEDKEYYILALLKLENKDKLCDLCSQYIEEKKVKSVREYARNFVYYVLPALPVFNPPKKKVKKPEELVDNKQKS